MLDYWDTATSNTACETEGVLGRVDSGVRCADHTVGKRLRSDDRTQLVALDDGRFEPERLVHGSRFGTSALHAVLSISE